jgi:hypothetical protein
MILALLFGGAIALGVLIAAGSAELSQPVKDVLLWNVNLVAKLAGKGPLLGYDSLGNPMYEGTPVHLFFGFLGLLSTFPIYMIACYLFLTIGNKIWFRPVRDL